MDVDYCFEGGSARLAKMFRRAMKVTLQLAAQSYRAFPISPGRQQTGAGLANST
jgi:hypothetical protein